MSEPFLGEVRLFGFNFPPRGWAKCDGQLLPINQNTALFSLLGTTYGGDGRTTFGLPELRGRAPIHHGTGPGLPSYSMGEKAGIPTTSLAVNNLPAHSHSAQLNASSSNAIDVNPSGTGLAVAREDTYSPDALDEVMQAGSVTTGDTGSGQAFNNMPPYLSMNWCIALVGVFPSRD